jgi:hypothetical protein
MRISTTTRTSLGAQICRVGRLHRHVQIADSVAC